MAASRCRSIPPASSGRSRARSKASLAPSQGYIGPVDFYVGLEPRYGVFSAPMLFRDEAHVAATIDDPEMQKIILDLAKPKRMVGIATLSIGVQ